MYAGFGISFLQYFIFLPVKIIHGKYILTVRDERDDLKSLFYFNPINSMPKNYKYIYIYPGKSLNTGCAKNVRSHSFISFFDHHLNQQLPYQKVKETLKTGICMIFFTTEIIELSIKYN